MTSKVENDFSEAHFDTISCFLSYGSAIWQCMGPGTWDRDMGQGQDQGPEYF